MGKKKLNLLEDDYGHIKLRLAGELGGLYSGQILQFSTKKVNEAMKSVIDEPGFSPVSVKKVANCNLEASAYRELLQMGTSSLQGIPSKIKLGKITFSIDKTPIKHFTVVNSL